MITRKRVMSALLIAAVSLGMIGITSSAAYAVNYAPESVSFSNSDGKGTGKEPQGWHKDGEYWY